MDNIKNVYVDSIYKTSYSLSISNLKVELK